MNSRRNNVPSVRSNVMEPAAGYNVVREGFQNWAVYRPNGEFVARCECRSYAANRSVRDANGRNY